MHTQALFNFDLGYTTTACFGEYSAQIEIDGLPTAHFLYKNSDTLLNDRVDPSTIAIILGLSQAKEWHEALDMPTTLRNMKRKLMDVGLVHLTHVLTAATRNDLADIESLISFWVSIQDRFLTTHRSFKGTQTERRLKENLALCHPRRNCYSIHPRAKDFIEKDWKTVVNGFRSSLGHN